MFIMIYGCTGVNRIGKLVLIDATLNKEGYLSILRETLKKSAEKFDILKAFTLYQNNDVKRKSCSILEWLLHNWLKVLLPPPQSPDMNRTKNTSDESGLCKFVFKI